jgi:alpha-ketoglutarate-dependent 2,4-dichlorophenoxyacetate dioxygenase
MSISIYPVTPDFAAEIGDIDLTKPLSPEDWTAVEHAFHRYAVLVFPEQDLSAQDHIDFAEHFGPIERERPITEKVTHAAFAHISNLAPDGSIYEADSRERMFKAGNKLWHTDSSFRFVPGLSSMLYTRTIAPIGGHTQFADQRAAYDALPEATKKRLAGLVAVHSIETSRRRSGFTSFSAEEALRMPPVPQALVRTIPENGRKSLYVASHAGTVQGMDPAEGRALIDELVEHVTQRQFVYTHRWRPKDLVMWDNRCTMHRGTDYDDLRWVRDMRRATVSDIANSCVQEGLQPEPLAIALTA